MEPTLITHPDWLAWPDERGPFGGRFPEGALNAKQFQAIVTLNDRRYGRVLGVYEGRTFNQLTDEIVEAHFRVGITDTHTRHCVLWLDVDGRQLASAITLDDRRAESWWVPSEKLERPWVRISPVHTMHRDGMWGLGGGGAVALTRQFVHDNHARKEA